MRASAEDHPRGELELSGLAMTSSTRLRDAYSLRLCMLNHRTTWDDARRTLEAVQRFGREAAAG